MGNTTSPATASANRVLVIAGVLIGVVVVATLLRFVQRDEIEMLSVSTAAIVGTLTNTILVVGS